jgi:hypothetical protein
MVADEVFDTMNECSCMVTSPRRHFGLEPSNFLILVGIVTELLAKFDSLGQCVLGLDDLSGFVFGEFRLHLREQVLLEELCDLSAPRMHDAVQAEVQVGLVELEQLHEQVLQLVVGRAHRLPLMVAASR